MRCLECQAEMTSIDTSHLIECCGLTLQEYALRHHLPLDLLVSSDQVNRPEHVNDYPIVHGTPSERARACLEGVRVAGLLSAQGIFQTVRGEVKALDLLLWNLQWLKEYGFRFRQTYEFDQLTNRVVARNALKALSRNLTGEPTLLSRVPPPEFLQSLAVCVSHIGEIHAGYLFLALPHEKDAQEILARLGRDYRINLVPLEIAPGSGLLRCDTPDDTAQLLTLLEPLLKQMPDVWERFTDETPQVTVSKEVVFDSAHFITDHPAKCSNLHGGRYALHVKIYGRIDPRTGCVVDYGYVKRVVNKLIVDRFDHHNLNYVEAGLSWRSSTELICVHIWERLIAYLPGLEELELYETTQSWCRYRGPTLAALRKKGSDRLLGHFQSPALGTSALRRLTREFEPPRLYAVVGS